LVHSEKEILLMLLLILLWALIGLILGLLTLSARLHATMRYGRLILPATGMAIAIIAGFVGLFLLGKDVATPWVLWITIVGLVGVPRLLTHK
jgi:hypothetical protein